MTAMRLLAGFLAAGMLAGCASTGVPEAVRKAPADAPALAQVRADPPAYEGAAVRWGGEVAEVRNEAEATWLEIVQRPLHGSGEPQPADRSEGRFLARVAGFLEPSSYAAGRRVTVTGRIDGTVDGAIDEYDYRYPVVAVEAHYLWPRETAPPYRRDAGYHGSWCRDAFGSAFGSAYCRPYWGPYW